MPKNKKVRRRHAKIGKRKARPASLKHVKPGKIITKGKVKRKAPPARGSIYSDVFKQMSLLKENGTAVVPCPSNISIPVFHNRLNAAMKRSGIVPPKGTEFRKFTTEDGQVAIECRPLKPAHT